MLGNVGNLYSALGQYDKALSNIELALQISREIGNKYLESMHLGNLAIILDNHGDLPTAIEKFKESLVVCEEIETCIKKDSHWAIWEKYTCASKSGMRLYSI